MGNPGIDVLTSARFRKPDVSGRFSKADQRGPGRDSSTKAPSLDHNQGRGLGHESDDSVSPIAADVRPPVPAYAGRTAFYECISLLRAMWQSTSRRRISLLAAGVAAIIAANMAGQIRLNKWHGAFFDALEQSKITEFYYQLIIFLGIVSVLLLLVVAQTWLHELLKVRLREWLTNHLMDEWLAPARPYRLAMAGPIGVNPDQRMEEDTRKLTELSANLGIGLFQSSLLLISFIGILWTLSNNVVFTMGTERITIPGYMVWCAILYTVIGSLLTWRVGLPLIGLNAERYAREAELRFALVRVSESAEGIALHNGERDERRQLDSTLDGVILAMRRLAVALTRLTWITSGYGWVAIVVPVVVASPGYFSGGLSLGGLMMVVGAFNQVQQSLRWFVDNFPVIADWRATLHRVSAFKAAVDTLYDIDSGIDHISLVEGEPGQLAFDNVSVLLSDGRVVIAEATVEIGAGERVLIVGESGAGKSTLFRAVAGLWPWGSGTIRLPAERSLMFMPQRPYLPLGNLRTAVTYPDAPSNFDDEKVKSALRRVGLTELLPFLDYTDRLDKSLSLGQQQLVGFARLLLHRPRWVFLDEATSALDEDNQNRAMSIFEHELTETTVLSIGHRPGLEQLHTRTLHLVRTPDGALLHPHLHFSPSAGWVWENS